MPVANLLPQIKAILVDRDAYLLALCRYVERNPVAAGLVGTRVTGPGQATKRMWARPNRRSGSARVKVVAASVMQLPAEYVERLKLR